MSRTISLDKVTPTAARRLMRDLTVKVTTASGTSEVMCFLEYNDKLHIPMGYDTTWLGEMDPLPTFSSHVYTPVKSLYSGKEQLERGVEPDKVKDQQEIYDQVIGWDSFALCLSTGMGKTGLSAIIAAKDGGRTIVFCPRIDILDQWEDEFKACGVTVGWVTNPQANELPDTTVLLSTIEMGRKLSPVQMRDIKTVIYDEAHLSTITGMTETLLKTTPARLIICTATMKRIDGAHKGLALYYGDHCVIRVLKKDFTIVKCLTGIVPNTSKKISIAGRSRMDYTAAIASINSDPRFPKLIANFLRALYHSTTEGKIVVLFREKCVINDVTPLLADVDYFVSMGSTKIKRELGNQRLILAIDKKMKEGVDLRGVKHVVQTYSSPSIEQAEGRARDDDFYFWYFVSDARVHENHWDEALKWCHERSRGEYVTKVLHLALEYAEALSSTQAALSQGEGPTKGSNEASSSTSSSSP